MKKPRSVRPISVLLVIAIALTSALIWSQSVKSVETSSQQSARVTEFVRPVLEKVVGKGNVTDRLVRKTAHFFEFSLLGCELFCLALALGLAGRRLLAAAFYALLAALTDETIQIFAERGPLVSDVWIDFAGALCGMLAGSLVYLLVLLIKKRKRRA
ncbi:MAG: VanZ family protein [Clostridia bacterium]|nr:VanZ family protein [Clostridia bacterium]